MPIDKEEFEKLPSKRRILNDELLDMMADDKAYSTNEIQEMLQISHSAVVLRLKRLMSKGFLRRKLIGKQYYWIKILDEEVKDLE